MWNHLKVHHPKIYKEIASNPVSSKLNQSNSVSKQTNLPATFMKMQPYDRNSKIHTDISRVITTFIAEDGLPVSTVEKSGFKKMIQFFDKRYQLPSRNHFSRIALPKLYNETREKVLNELESVSYYSATADGWSSNFVYEPYLSLTVQYVSDDWKMNSIMLETYPITEDHTGENLAAAMDEALERLGLSKSRLAAITTDSVPNMKCACEM
jgi:L,D-peptidoglycan transpeptidase YkuD (ErfK/YbiS/YcfS/YnhG family)